MNWKEEALKLHKANRGKLAIASKVEVKDAHDLSIIYTPGVAEPCLRIKADKSTVYDYTAKGNMVAIVTDGSAVLGLGNIGPEAALPVMEGKALLFKKFGGIDAFPVCLNTQEIDKIVETVRIIAPGFGGINLEDISAPRCFEIEERLIKALDIPVFHDDQHGTAVVVLAGLINSLKLVKKEFRRIKAVINGAGAAGVTIAKILLRMKIKEIIMVDSRGIIYRGREDLVSSKKEISRLTNLAKIEGGLDEAVKGADIFIGVSRPGVLNEEMVKKMAALPVIFALSNPDPEIEPADAERAGAAIVATGRSDYPNQVNNALVFPGIFKGALKVRASRINEEMKVAAARALAGVIKDKDLNKDYIIPDAFNPAVVSEVASAVARAAVDSGVAAPSKTDKN